MSTIVLATTPNGFGPTDVGIRLTINDGLGLRTAFINNQNIQNSNELLGLNFFTNPGNVFTVGALLQNPTGVNAAITSLCQLQVLEDECYQVTWEKGATPPVSWSIAGDPLGSSPNNAGAFYYNVNLRSLRLTQFVPSLLSGVPPTPVWVQTFLKTDTIPIDSSTEPCCVSETSLVKTHRGWIEAGAVRSGDRVFTSETDSITVHRNIRFMVPSDRFIRLPGEPADLLIKANHPVFENGEEVLAQDSNVSMGEIQLSKPQKICTLITERREFVNMSGIMVATWSDAAFQNFVQHDKTGQGLRFESL